jgi:hypothetical protein
MVNRVHTESQLPMHGMKIGGMDQKNHVDIKASSVAKVVFAALSVAAAVGFTFLAVVTANPLFMIGTAVAVGVLLGLSGVQIHATAGYRRNRFIDPTFYEPFPPRVPAYRGPARQAPRANFNPMRDHGVPARNAGVPARGNTPVIPVRETGAFHAPVGGRR